MKSEYKETQIGKIPEDWDVVRLGDIAEYIKGKKPEKMIEEIKEGYLSYLSTGYLRSDKKTKFAKISKNVILANENDLILLWDGSKAGEFFAGRKGILSSTMVKIQFRKKDFNQLFLFHSLKLMERYLSGQTKGTGIPHVDKNVLNNLKIPLPPLPEQKAIASILSTVDNAIQKAGEGIAKTEKLKGGLLQDLLTKGITHKEFKDTEIGRIPENWDITILGNFAEILMGQSPPGETYNKRGEGIPLLNGPAEFGKKFPKPVKWTTNPTKVSKMGDILLCVRGHTTGRLNISDGKYCIGRGVAVIRQKKNISEENFLYYLLGKVQGEIFRLSSTAGSTFPNITSVQLNKFKIPCPSLSEQQKIAEILSTVDKKLELQRKRKGKLEWIKKGLMNDLLTGRKRVKGFGNA